MQTRAADTAPLQPGIYHQSIDVSVLQFDPENPRIPRGVNTNSEVAIIEWMLEDATLPELMAAIGEQGYFPGEPVLVVPARKAGRYIVIEGNRRLAAVKLLSDPGLARVRSKTVRQIAATANHRPQELPAIEFEDRASVLTYLGYRHVTGIQEWGPLAKARYLEQLADIQGLRLSGKDLEALARAIGSKADYVARLLTGYHLYERMEARDFFGFDLNEEKIKFAVFTTALSYQNIAEFLGLKSGADPSLKGLEEPRLRELTEWLFVRDSENQTRLGESRNLRHLSAVVAKPGALKQFRAGKALLEAALLTDEPRRVFIEQLLKSQGALENARNHMHLVDKFPPTVFDILKEIRGIANVVRLHVTKSGLDEDPDEDQD